MPELTESPAQAIEGHFGPPQAPVGALAPMQEQLATSKPQRGRKPGEQKSIGQRHQQEHCAPRLPALQAQGFDEQFAFLKTETCLDLEAPDRGEDDVPGLLACLDRFIGEQIPGFTPLALAHHHQPQLASIRLCVAPGKRAPACCDRLDNAYPRAVAPLPRGVYRAPSPRLCALAPKHR